MSGRARARPDSTRRAAILRQATEIFERKGFEQTTIEDIAEAVGVTREAVYYYFRDKAEILAEVIRPESEYLLYSARRIAALPMSPRARLVLAVENHMMRFNPNYLSMAVAVRELGRRGHDPRMAALRIVWARYSAIWVRLIEEGQRAGEVPAGLNPKHAAYGILGMCNSASGWFRPGPDGSAMELARTFVRIASAGLFVTPDGAAPDAAVAAQPAQQ
ncbi:MAG: TetR family transcriptional regulator [Rhodobacteraceae bacterium]|nr:TetR family transcriptional regulator [Paracoccaceae bacterium]